MGKAQDIASRLRKSRWFGPTMYHLLFSVPQKHRLRLVATDGAFSMDGDIAPLQEICRLAAKYGALVFVDECHATGFLGPTGRWEHLRAG